VPNRSYIALRTTFMVILTPNNIVTCKTVAVSHPFYVWMPGIAVFVSLFLILECSLPVHIMASQMWKFHPLTSFWMINFFFFVCVKQKREIQAPG
jgi:hypothetical protein